MVFDWSLSDCKSHQVSRTPLSILTDFNSAMVSISKTDSGLGIYHLSVWSNIDLLHNSKSITFPTQSYLVLCTVYARLLYSLIMWLTLFIFVRHNQDFAILLQIINFCFDVISSFMHYFVLLLKEIQFLSWGFLLLAMSKCNFISF